MTDVGFFSPGARLALELECLLMDTPMADPPLAQSLRRLHQDDGN